MLRRNLDYIAQSYPKLAAKLRALPTGELPELPLMERKHQPNHITVCLGAQLLTEVHPKCRYLVIVEPSPWWLLSMFSKVDLAAVLGDVELFIINAGTLEEVQSFF